MGSASPSSQSARWSPAETAHAFPANEGLSRLAVFYPAPGAGGKAKSLKASVMKENLRFCEVDQVLGKPRKFEELHGHWRNTGRIGQTFAMKQTKERKSPHADCRG
jgi:hypothetical protein